MEAALIEWDKDRKEWNDMKATGIVRRIDSCVILGAKAESLENTGFSLISVHFSIPKTVMLLPSQRQ